MKENDILSDLQALLEEPIINNSESTRINQNEISNPTKVTLLDETEETNSEDSVREPSLILRDYTRIEEKMYDIDESVKRFKEEHKEIFDFLESIEKEKAELSNEQSKLKNEMCESLGKSELKTISNSMFTVTYVAETQRNNFDKKAFEKKYPELCKQFITVSKVSAYTKWTKVK